MAYRTCEGSVNSIFSVICFGNEFLRFVSPSRHSLHQRPQRPASWVRLYSVFGGIVA